MLQEAVTLDAEDVGAQLAEAGRRAELLNESEFQDLYRLHARPLWAYLYRLTGNTADADDLLQEAFCRMLAAPLATRDDGQLRAYLFRVATNAATDVWRRGGRNRRGTETMTATARPSRDAAAAEPSVEADHGDAAALKRDMARTFRDLKPQDRMLLWLAHVEGSKHREIAAALGLKAASVPVLLFRARRKLAGLLRKKGYGPGGPS
jgi:RNA polymerase sigma-70 factor, ECF subfamily